MTWMTGNPDTPAEFSNAFYDELDAEQAEADALADRLANHGPAPTTFTAAALPPAGGEDNAPDARPIPARREQPSPTEPAE